MRVHACVHACVRARACVRTRVCLSYWHFEATGRINFISFDDVQLIVTSYAHRLRLAFVINGGLLASMSCFLGWLMIQNTKCYTSMDGFTFCVIYCPLWWKTFWSSIQEHAIAYRDLLIPQTKRWWTKSSEICILLRRPYRGISIWQMNSLCPAVEILSSINLLIACACHDKDMLNNYSI